MAQRNFNTSYLCPICQRIHAIRECTRYLILPVDEKVRIVAQKGLCYNCLAQSHTIKACKCIDKCRRCSKAHHSTLHPISAGNVWVKMTAVIKVRPMLRERTFALRAVIDPNAERSTITILTVARLLCEVKQDRVKLQVFYEDCKKHFYMDFFVVNKYYPRTPTKEVNKKTRFHNEVFSADIKWYQSLPYEVVLGTDVASRILTGPAVGKPGEVYAQETIFGLAFFWRSLQN